MTADSAPQRRLTLEDLDQFLSPTPAVEGADAYLEAAAVLATFDPFALRPVGGRTEGEAREHLLSLCEPVTEGPDRGRWTLPLDERRGALRKLGTRERMQEALQANPERSATPLQRIFERLLDPAPIQIAELSRDELAALITAVEWVDGILDGLPQRAELQRALSRSDLLAPMRRLAGSDFVGREKELARLESFAAGAQPSAPLFVFGPGGVGKSTLLARFLLKHVVPKDIPFAYIDIDRPTIRPDLPLTLLLEAITQLLSQVDTPPGAAEGLLKEITYAIRRRDSSRHFESMSASFFPFLDQLASLLRPRLEHGPVVFIIDTMEEAQFLGTDVMWPLLEELFAIQESEPGFRVILAGRTLPSEFTAKAFPFLSAADIELTGEAAALDQIPEPIRPINLGVLDLEPARELLQGSLQASGLDPLPAPDLDEVIGIVTHNPMCLKLAARLLRDEGVEKLRASRSELLAKLKAEKVQALLYGRILRHLHGDDVRKIAYPGLIVRRITPEVIRKVLAEPCELELRAERNELGIFEELGKEAALVTYDPKDGSLRHRPDVRRAMLEDLTDQVDEAVVESIDRGAVRFYEREPGPIARAEEIYHRLRLREPDETLAERWVEEAGIHLKGAVEELPPQQKLWLAERLGITLDESVRQAASQETWEAQAARAADRFLSSHSAERALAVLQERSTRSPRSRLYTLEAEAYRLLGHFDDALRVARSGVESASKAGAIDMALELLLKMVVIEEGRERLQSADELLRETAAVAVHSNNELLQLRVKVTWLRVDRQLRPGATQGRSAMRQEVLDSLTDDKLRQLRAQPVLLRELAAELATQDGRIASTAIETLGIEVNSDEQARALGKAFATLQEGDEGAVPILRKSMKQFQKADYDPTTIRKWVTEELTERDTRRLGSALVNYEPEAKVLRAFREYFRAGVAGNLRGDFGDGEI